MTTQEENPEYTGRALTKETTVNPNDTVPSYDPGWVLWKQVLAVFSHLIFIKEYGISTYSIGINGAQEYVKVISH